MTINTDTAKNPWGAWATTGFGILIMIVFVVVQVGVSVGFGIVAALTDQHKGAAASLTQLESTGYYLSIATVSTTLICCALIALIIRGRKQLTINDYLGLHKFNWKAFRFWLVLLLLFFVINEAITSIFDIPVPDFMLHAYSTAGFLPLFWIALVFAAPIFEEVFFRGFLLEGLRRTWMRDVGAIVLLSAIWAIIHFQYDFYYIAMIFLMGVMFGYAKIKSGSLYMPMALHAISNFIATLEVSLLY